LKRLLHVVVVIVVVVVEMWVCMDIEFIDIDNNIN